MKQYPGRGLTPDKTRAPNDGTDMHVMRSQGGYRINQDSSVNFAEGVIREREETDNCNADGDGGGD